MKKGLLLLNLGTPEGEPGKGPSTSQVRAYLREFLMDPYVVDLPWVARAALVYGFVLPTRSAKSAAAYAKIWTERGSPLLVHLNDLVDGVRRELGGGWAVEPAMRYGKPSIGQGLRRLAERGAREALVLPLYPQYSLAATESSIEECRAVAARVAPELQLRFVPPFYREPEFIGSFAERARGSLEDFHFDHLLFSFHGLPERHLRKADRAGGSRCGAGDSCCERVLDANRDCYRAQCFATAREIAGEIGLPAGRYTVCFQSRMGRTPWIRPHTDVVYRELAQSGTKRLAVICPAFVADCLETLEEIEIRAREEFVALGGEDLRLVPSLNASSRWVRGVSAMVRRGSAR